MAISDFVDVQLSPAGVAAVGANGAIRYSKRHMNYFFTPGTPVRVLTSEWSSMLSKQLSNGQPTLQVAPVATAAANAVATAAAVDPEAELQALQAQEATIEAEIANKKKGGK